MTIEALKCQINSPDGGQLIRQFSVWTCCVGVCVRVVVSCVVCGLCRGVWCVRCKCSAWVPCVALCGAVVCCVSVKCCVREMLCACWLCVLVCVGVCWCVLCGVCVVWCLLWCGMLKTSVCAFNTSPCVRSKCPRVYQQHAHMFYTCGHAAGTHGDVLNVHTQAF